jgi:hypothetical protein
MHGHVTRQTARSPPRMRAPHKRPAKRRPLVERKMALFWIGIHEPDWMTEEAARAHRRRSLLQDNPTSG